MRSKSIYILLIFNILLFFQLSSQNNIANNGTLPIPNPVELSTDWWFYLEGTPEQVALRSNELIESLKASAESLQEENRKQADLLIGKIETALENYQKVLQIPDPQPPPSTPFSDTYTIDQLLAIFNSLQKNKVTQRANRQEQKSEENQIARLEDYLSNLRGRYRSAAERSEKKFLIGLEIILSVVTEQVSILHLEDLKLETEIRKKRIEQLNEEIEFAQDRLQSSSEELAKFRENAAQSEMKWEEAYRTLQDLESQASMLPAAEGDLKVDLSNKIFQSRLKEATIREALTRTILISDRGKYELSRVLIAPLDRDLQSLRHDVLEWNEELEATKASIENWLTSVNELLQQDVRSLISEGDDPLQDPQIRELVDVNQNSRLIIDNLQGALETALFVTHTLNRQLDLILGNGHQWITSIWNGLNYVYDNFSAIANKSLLRIGPDRSITIASILKFLLIILITLWVARIIRRGLRNIAQGKRGIQTAMAYKSSRLVSYLIIALGLLLALSTLGFDLSTFVLLAGALGVGLGFGLQSIFNNFISGLIILFESQLQVGDFIELEEGGLRGEIREIRFRSTVITTNDGTEVLVPNSEMISKRLINWTLREPYRRIRIPFFVAYGTDKELVQKVVIDAAKSIPNTLLRPGIPEPRVQMAAFGDSALKFELVVWVDEPSSRHFRNTLSTYLWAIDTALQKNGIRIPFPQQEVHVVSENPEDESATKT